MELIDLAEYPWVYLWSLNANERYFRSHGSHGAKVSLNLIPFQCQNTTQVIFRGHMIEVSQQTKSEIRTANVAFVLNPIGSLDLCINELQEFINKNMSGEKIRYRHAPSSPAIVTKQLILLERAKEVWLAVSILPSPIVDELLLAGILVDGQ